MVFCDNIIVDNWVIQNIDILISGTWEHINDNMKKDICQFICSFYVRVNIVHIDHYSNYSHKKCIFLFISSATSIAASMSSKEGWQTTEDSLAVLSDSLEHYSNN